MALRTAGMKVVIDGEKEYKQALTDLNNGNRVLASEMKKLQAEYKGNTDSVEFLTKKGDVLERELLNQKEKVETLRQALDQAAKKYGEGSTQAMKYQAELNNAEAAQYDLEHAIQENTEAIDGQGSVWNKVGGMMEEVAGKLGIKIPDGAKKALSGMKGLSSGTVAAMTAAAAAIALVAKAVSELHEMTLQAAADVDEIATQSMTTGLSTRTIQELKYAENMIDVSVDTISGSMTKLTKSMADANSGSEAMAEKFEELGVSITDTATGQLRSAEDVFYDVIDALGGIENQTERDAAAMELLGKSAQELNPLIIQGSGALKDFAKEAEATGYVLDESQIEKLAAVDDAYQRMQLQMEATKKQMAADFAPASEAAMELFTKVVKAASDALEKSGMIENLASIIKSLLSILETGGSILKGIPGFGSALDSLRAMLQGVAIVMATIADTANVVAGLLTLDFSRVKQGLGMDAKNGNYSNLQQINGTAKNMEAVRNGYRGNGGEDMSKYGYDAASGRYYDLTTGNYIFGHNAGGSSNWRGGPTELGEAGPETAILPQGTRILTAQETENLGGDTYNFNINVDDLADLQALILWAKSARVTKRMR